MSVLNLSIISNNLIFIRIFLISPRTMIIMIHHELLSLVISRVNSQMRIYKSMLVYRQKFIHVNLRGIHSTKKYTKVNLCFYSIYTYKYLYSVLGISNTFQSQHMEHNDYVQSLLCENPTNDKLATSTHFEIKHHKIYTVEKSKKYLTPFNDKKYFTSATSCLSFGHKDICKQI